MERWIEHPFMTPLPTWDLAPGFVCEMDFIHLYAYPFIVALFKYVGPFWARNQRRLIVSGPLGQVLDREGEQRREQSLLPQDEGRLLQIPGRGRSGRRPLV